MFIFPYGRFLVAAFFLLAVFLLPSNAEASHCPAFPSVSWWKDVTHESTIALVKRKHHGDWRPLIRNWQNNLSKLQTIQKKGSVASIRYKKFDPILGYQTRKVILQGDKLDAYIDDVWRRLAVLYCLSDMETAGQKPLDNGG
jgi:hypothetical protein